MAKDKKGGAPKAKKDGKAKKEKKVKAAADGDSQPAPGGKKGKKDKKEKQTPEEKAAKAAEKEAAKASKAAEKEEKKKAKEEAKAAKAAEKEAKRLKKEAEKLRKAEVKARKKAIKELGKEKKAARKAHAALEKERRKEEALIRQRSRPLALKLGRAAAGGWAPNVEHWLDEGADPNTYGDDGFTPLANAARWGHLEAVQLLLAAGADPDLKDDAMAGGHTALWRAVAADERLVARALLEAGADPDIASAHGDTPLAFAVRIGHAETAELLLRAGADPDLPNETGDTPLMAAVLDTAEGRATGAAGAALREGAAGGAQPVPGTDGGAEGAAPAATAAGAAAAAGAAVAGAAAGAGHEAALGVQHYGMAAHDADGHDLSEYTPGLRMVQLLLAHGVADVHDREGEFARDRAARLAAEKRRTPEGAAALARACHCLKEAGAIAPHAERFSLMDKNIRLLPHGAHDGGIRLAKDHRGVRNVRHTALVQDFTSGMVSLRFLVRVNCELDRCPAQRKRFWNRQVTGAPNAKKLARRLHLRSRDNRIEGRPFAVVERVFGAERHAVVQHASAQPKPALAMNVDEWVTESEPAIDWEGELEKKKEKKGKKGKGKKKGKKK